MMSKLKNHRYVFVIVASLCALAVMMAILLPRSSTWYDESYTATLVSHSPSDIIDLTRLDVHPPLYYLVLKIWAVLFGYQTVVLRVFSALCMLAAIIILVRFLYRHVSRRSAAYTAAALVISPYLLRYSVEMRMYAFGSLLGVLATTVFYRLAISRGRSSQLWYGVYALLAAALVYTQYFFGLILVGHLVYLLIYQSEKGRVGQRLLDFCRSYKGIIGSYGLAILLFVPWLPTFINQIRNVQNGFWISPVSAVTPLDSAAHLLALSPYDKIQGWSALIFCLGLVGVIFAIKQAGRALNTAEQAIVRLGLTAIGTTAVMLFILSLPPNQSLYHNRYLMVTSIFFYTATAISLSRLPVKKYWLIYGAIGVLAATGVGRAFTEGNNFDRSPHYFSSTAISQRLSQEYRKGDIVLSTGLWTYLDAYQYFQVDHKDTAVENILLYQPGKEYQKRGPESVLYDRQEAMIRPHQLCGLLPSSGRLWVIDEPKPQIAKVPESWLASSEEVLSQGYARLVLVNLPASSSASCQLVNNRP